MGSEPLACPLCGTAMADATSQSSGRTCRSCGARLIGLAPFERLLQEGVGNGVWIACAETPRSGPACPFCQQGMHQPPPEAVMPKDLSVCRLCQQVLVPASATEWMTQFALSAPGAGPVAAPAPATPTDCSNCGAPYEPDENGCCRYCHAHRVRRQPLRRTPGFDW
jgi:hypothetical protein